MTVPVAGGRAPPTRPAPDNTTNQSNRPERTPNMNKQETRAAKAQEQYDTAVAQAQAVPSGYTRRQVKKADRARKLAAIPMWRRVVPSVVLVGLFLIVVVSCGANAAADRAEVERCLAVAEASGWDSSVPAIQNACADADSRQRILDGEGGKR